MVHFFWSPDPFQDARAAICGKCRRHFDLMTRSHSTDQLFESVRRIPHIFLQVASDRSDEAIISSSSGEHFVMTRRSLFSDPWIASFLITDHFPGAGKPIASRPTRPTPWDRKTN